MKDYMVLLLGVHDNGSVVVTSLLASSGVARPGAFGTEETAGGVRQAGRNAGEAPECAGAKISDIPRVRNAFSFHEPAYMLAAVPRTVRSDLRVAVTAVPGGVATGQDA